VVHLKHGLKIMLIQYKHCRVVAQSGYLAWEHIGQAMLTLIYWMASKRFNISYGQIHEIKRSYADC